MLAERFQLRFSCAALWVDNVKVLFRIVNNLIATNNMCTAIFCYLYFRFLPLKYPAISVGREHVKKLFSFKVPY